MRDEADEESLSRSSGRVALHSVDKLQWRRGLEFPLRLQQCEKKVEPLQMPWSQVEGEALLQVGCTGVSVQPNPLTDCLADLIKPSEAVALGAEQGAMKPMCLLPMIAIKVSADRPDGKDKRQTRQFLPSLA